MFQIELIFPDGTSDVIKASCALHKGEYILFKHKEFIVISVTHDLRVNHHNNYYMHKPIIRLRERQLDN